MTLAAADSVVLEWMEEHSHDDPEKAYGGARSSFLSDLLSYA